MLKLRLRTCTLMCACVCICLRMRANFLRISVRVGDFPPTQMIYNKLYLVSRLVFAGDNLMYTPLQNNKNDVRLSCNSMRGKFIVCHIRFGLNSLIYSKINISTVVFITKPFGNVISDFLIFILRKTYLIRQLSTLLYVIINTIYYNFFSKIIAFFLF